MSSSASRTHPPIDSSSTGQAVPTAESAPDAFHSSTASVLPEPISRPTGKQDQPDITTLPPESMGETEITEDDQAKSQMALVVEEETLGARGPGNQQKHLEYIAGSG